ncbi:hypothetical protein [Mucisphaera sp.]|uniref:hypothetical protein n=1 Tax=Mucisphaera sp. TaxID=2913024 RepID=UPI003D10F2AF
MIDARHKSWIPSRRVSTHGRLRTLIAALGLGLLTASASNATIQINLNTGQTSHELLGFGAQTWAGDTVGQGVLNDLNMRYTRLHFGSNFFQYDQQPPSDSNQIPDDNWEAMYDHVAAYFNGNNGSRSWQLTSLQQSAEFARQNDIELILNEFQIPHSFLNNQNTAMFPLHADDFATFWSAMIVFLDDNGIRPSWIELANEPNGTWNGRIGPDVYNTLVKQTRASLDARGYQDVGILGPGLSNVGESEAWLLALDSDAVDAIGGWSAHLWDDWRGVEPTWEALDTSIQHLASQVNPTADDKPIFLTEYATAIRSFDGVDYTNADEGGNVAEAEAFAVRVVQNTLHTINLGVATPIFWEAADQPWNNLTWGLRRIDGTERPTYDALDPFLSFIDAGAEVIQLPETAPQDEFMLLRQDGELVLIAANTTGSEQTCELSLEDVPWVRLIEQTSFAAGSGLPHVTLSPLGTITWTLPHQSTLALLLDADLPVGDLTGDGVLNLDDINLLISFQGDATYDLTGDATTDVDDLRKWVTVYFGSQMGDANLDSRVDLLDLSALAASFGKTAVNGYADGDFNGNGTVSLLDLSILASNFGFHTSVPEPASVGVLGMITMLGLGRRRSIG